MPSHCAILTEAQRKQCETKLITSVHVICDPFFLFHPSRKRGNSRTRLASISSPSSQPLRALVFYGIFHFHPCKKGRAVEARRNTNNNRFQSRSMGKQERAQIWILHINLSWCFNIWIFPDEALSPPPIWGLSKYFCFHDSRKKVFPAILAP